MSTTTADWSWIWAHGLKQLRLRGRYGEAALLSIAHFEVTSKADEWEMRLVFPDWATFHLATIEKMLPSTIDLLEGVLEEAAGAPVNVVIVSSDEGQVQ